MKFETNELESARIEEFRIKHKGCISPDAMGMKYTYQIIPGGIGTVWVVKCNICGEEKNITDYDVW